MSTLDPGDSDAGAGAGFVVAPAWVTAGAGRLGPRHRHAKPYDIAEHPQGG